MLQAATWLTVELNQTLAVARLAAPPTSEYVIVKVFEAPATDELPEGETDTGVGCGLLLACVMVNDWRWMVIVPVRVEGVLLAVKE